MLSDESCKKILMQVDGIIEEMEFDGERGAFKVGELYEYIENYYESMKYLRKNLKKYIKKDSKK